MPALDPHANHANTIVSPSVEMVAITPNDSADLAKVVRRLYVGVGGDVRVIGAAGNTVTFKNAPSGGYIGDAKIVRVLATGTTATDLIGMV